MVQPKPPESKPQIRSSQAYRDRLHERAKDLESKASSEQEKEAIQETLFKLLRLEHSDGQMPIDAIEAVKASAVMGLPCPEWAAAMIGKIFNDRLTGEVQSLDKVFGFTGHNNHTAEMKKRAYRQRDEGFMSDIFRLRLLDFPMDQACEMVAKNILANQEWNHTFYELGFNTTEPDSLKVTLRDKYYKEGWNQLFEDLYKNNLQQLRKELKAQQGPFLATFEV